MSRQQINIGASANDGTGDSIRVGGGHINQNFEELYNVLGWGFYVDAETTPATQTITTTASKLQIDGGGATSESNYLPREIRGSSELWDTTNDKITPIETGDAYDLRIQFEVTGTSANPNYLTLELDIGGGATPTTVIVDRYIGVTRSTPFTISVGFPIFCLATFKANGGQIFLKTDTGTVTIGGRSIFIKRDFKGGL